MSLIQGKSSSSLVHVHPPGPYRLCPYNKLCLCASSRYMCWKIWNSYLFPKTIQSCFRFILFPLFYVWTLFLFSIWVAMCVRLLCVDCTCIEFVWRMCFFFGTSIFCTLYMILASRECSCTHLVTKSPLHYTIGRKLNNIENVGWGNFYALFCTKFILLL
jgi:hypothetical protein